MSKNTSSRKILVNGVKIEHLDKKTMLAALEKLIYKYENLKGKQIKSL